MLKLTKKADYGLIAVKHLAEVGETGSCSAKDIADAYGIPPSAMAKILQKLVKNGLLVSHQGMNGGYVLARDARNNSTPEVIKAIQCPRFLPPLTGVTHGRPARTTLTCPARKRA